jgi:hypothetical protein
MASSKEQPLADDMEKAAPGAVKDGADEEDEYPPFAKVVFIMAALYLAMFLVALVSLSAIEFCMPTDLGRTEQYWGRPSQRSLTTSIPLMMLAGMQARTFSRSARFNSSMAGYIPSIPVNGSCSAPSFCSKLEYAISNHLVPLHLLTIF